MDFVFYILHIISGVLHTFAAPFILAALNTLTFVFVWRRIPVRWLFDCSGLPSEDCSLPHPLALHLQWFPHGLALFLFFAVLTLTSSEKVAQIAVFWLLCLFWFLAQTALADHFYRLIPDQWSLGIAALGLMRLTWDPSLHLRPQLSPLLFCIVAFVLLYLLPLGLSGTPAMGLGDIKLLFALAIALPPEIFYGAMIRAALLGGAVAAVMLLMGRAGRGVPFGTVLAAGVFLIVLLP